MSLSSRNRKLTEALDLSGIGLEYGPLHRTILPKSDYGVRYIDFASRKQLVEHYAKSVTVDTNLIPEIDIVTGGKTICDFVDPSSVDFVVAAHVWEHVPNFIGWLQDNLTVLRPGGRMAVAYPDKRYCFDMRRRSTTFSDILAAYFEKRTRPTFAQICDHFLNVVKVTPAQAWSGAVTKSNAEFVRSREAAVRLLRQKAQSDEYTDCHCWIFKDIDIVPILEEIKSLLPIRFEVAAFSPTARGSNEFYITIEKSRC